MNARAKDEPMNEQAWRSRHHETISKRSRKGSTSQEVKRYGAATITGSLDRDHLGRPLLAMPDHAELASAAARALHTDRERGDLRKMVTGWDAAAVLQLTETLYGDEIEPLLGEDSRRTRAYQQQVRADRSSYCSSAFRTSHLGDVLDAVPHSTTTRDLIAAQRDVYAADTSTKLAWPRRVRLGSVRLRKSEPKPAPMFVVDSEGQAVRTTYLVSASTTPGTMWRGHQLVQRGETSARRSKVRQAAADKRKARTTGTVEAPSTIQGWEELLSMVNRSERLLVTSDAGRVTISRSPEGVYSAITPAGRIKARTIAGMATRLA
jgi:hypothetical protein